MNLDTSLKWNTIIIVILVILIIYTSQYIIINNESYINYPQQVDTKKIVESDPEANQANENYAQILYYLQKNPEKSVNFITDLQRTFFNSNCQIKSNIDFNTLTKGHKLIF